MPPSSPGRCSRAGHAARVEKGRASAGFAGALDAGVADQILGDFELALGARLMGQAGSVAGWFPRRARLARGVSVPPAAAGGSAAGRPGAGTAAGQAHAPVPLGQIVRVRGADVHSKVCLLSYARVASGPQFSVFARTRQRSGWWEPRGRGFSTRSPPSTTRGSGTRSPSATSAAPCSGGPSCCALTRRTTRGGWIWPPPAAARRACHLARRAAGCAAELVDSRVSGRRLRVAGSAWHHQPRLCDIGG